MLFRYVEAVPLSGGGRSWSDLDVRGDRFQVTDLLPGKYRFDAFQLAVSNSVFDANTVAAARQTVEVGTSDVDGVELTLAPTLDLEGSVVFESGCAAEPVWITLTGDSGQFLRAGADGQFVVRHLIPGNYKVFVRLEIPSNAFAGSAKLGETEILADGFEATANTKGPLRIAMSCGRR